MRKQLQGEISAPFVWMRIGDRAIKTQDVKQVADSHKLRS